jgi:hypothetical protein
VVIAASLQSGSLNPLFRSSPAAVGTCRRSSTRTEPETPDFDPTKNGDLNENEQLNVEDDQRTIVIFDLLFPARYSNHVQRDFGVEGYECRMVGILEDLSNFAPRRFSI